MQPVLSLSGGAELLNGPEPPDCALPIRTYTNLITYAGRVLTTPLLVPELATWLRNREVDVALCAMPGPLDFVMAAALRRAAIPYAVVVHDADPHPGDWFPPQIRLQRRLVRGASAVFALSSHVAERIRQQRIASGKPVLRASLPPFHYGPALPPAGAHGGRLRLLSFGRLLAYKGLDLLADSLKLLGPACGLEVRIVGSGPESAELDRLRALPGVTVENRWVPEKEVPSLLGWADGIVLSHREASQSGVAAAAIAAGRWIVATRVGGLEEQLKDWDRALLCDPTPESIAGGIARLLASDRAPLPRMADPRAAWARVARLMVRDLETIAASAERSAEAA